MALPVPPVSRSASMKSLALQDDTLAEVQSQQAGRSATSLAAERSAHELREADRARPATANSPIESPTSSIPDGSSGGVVNSAEPARSKSYQPIRPSPLNPNSSGSSIAPSIGHADEKNITPSRDLNTASNTGSRPRPATAPSTATQSAPLSGDGRAVAAPSRPSQPVTLRDLGTDYTRFYNPYISPTTSRVDVDASAKPPTLERKSTDPSEEQNKTTNSFFTALPLCKPERPAGAGGLDASPISIPVSRATSRAASTTTTTRRSSDGDSEKALLYQYFDDRFGAPRHEFPLITDEKEDDDDMHMPMWDDDQRFKPRLRDRFNRENIVSTIGLFIMAAGLICVILVLPFTFYASDGLFGNRGGSGWSGPAWAHVNDRTYPLLTNTRTGLIDPDTPADAMTRVSVTGETFNLVFSDEFNEDNRTFYEGDDPYWYGFDGWYGATEDLEWYDPDAINTGAGVLQLQMDKFTSHNLSFRSGMLNSWNQLCFKGGIFEVSVSLPGPAGVHGLWPGMWTMGNLGRPGYLATTDGLWPYTYNECDSGITPNQSMIDGTSKLPGQRLNSCTCPGQDHPTPGTGRGAPEIDIAEVSADWGGLGLGVATQSYQVAPFDIWYYPNYDFMQLPDYSLSFVNTYTGGAYQQAISTTTMLNNDWYDGKSYQKFAYEYEPGTTSDSFIAWTISDQEMMRFDARAIGPNGNIGQRIISEEPMSIILNLGISNNWVDIQWAELFFPTVLRIDYVRWYQREGAEMVTCDPPGYETTEYIQNHPAAYNNVNFTHWKHTGYEWPTNSYMHECSA